MPKRARGRARFHRVPVCGKRRFSPASFRTKPLTKSVKAVIGCKKGQFRKGRCRVGTTVQSLLFDKDKFTMRKAKAWKNKNFRSCRL